MSFDRRGIGLNTAADAYAALAATTSNDADADDDDTTLLTIRGGAKADGEAPRER